MSGATDGDGGDGPRNVVAIFHASFHPTKGNTIDWSLTLPSSSSPSPTPTSTTTPIDLTGVEFSVLPSGLHLVPQDVIYFTHNSYTGLAIFRRRPTIDKKHHRGFRLGSLGVLVEEGERPRPWCHLETLKVLVDELYGEAERREREVFGEAVEDLLGLGDGEGEGGPPGDLRESDFECVRRWFEERKVRSAPGEKPSPVDVWSGWSDELDGTFACKSTPTHHLPHLLRILGLSSLTLYKFVLARRRILIYTRPPVEVAGVLAWAASDMCREHHMSPRSSSSAQAFGVGVGVPMPDLFASNNNNAGQQKPDPQPPSPPPRSPESPRVLGMITLTDIPRLEQESQTGKGWIAVTTDAIFLEKPQYYDLVLDLTGRGGRPSLFMSVSKEVQGWGAGGGGRRRKWKLESVRFTWSDVKLWAELDRILNLDSTQSYHGQSHDSGPSLCCQCSPKSPSSRPTPGSPGGGVWADAFKIYEDVCLLCATLWMGLGTWRSNNTRGGFASRDPVVDDYFDFDVDEGGGNGNDGEEEFTMAGVRRNGRLGAGTGTSGGSAQASAPVSPSVPSLSKKKDKAREGGETKIRAVGLGIEGRPRGKGLGLGQGVAYGHGHARKASASSSMSMKVPAMTAHIEAVSPDQQGRGEQEQDDDDGASGFGSATHAESGPKLTQEEKEEIRRRQNVQTTLALLQTFHANTVFWLSKLREMVPPPLSPSSSPSPSSSIPARGGGIGYAVTARAGSKGIRLPSEDYQTGEGEGEEGEDGKDEEDERSITITARDLLSLELGVLSELDARFVEWLVEAEGYASSSLSGSLASGSSRRKMGVVSTTATGGKERKRRVVVKRGWQELFGILLGLK